MWYGMGSFAAAIIASLVAARRGSWAKPAVAVALLNLLFAGVNSSAPFRGLLDPHYVGYRYGMFAADSPAAVFLISGLVFIAASLAAVLAASNSVGCPMLLVAVIDGVFLVNSTTSFLYSPGTHQDFEIQFGEFLTIPSAIGVVLILLLFIVPLIGATAWAGRRAVLSSPPSR